MAIQVTLDAETAELLGEGFFEGQTMTYAEFEAEQDRIRAAKKLALRVEQYNAEKAKIVRRARLLKEAQENLPEIFEDLSKRASEAGFTVSNSDDVNVPSELVKAEPNSETEKSGRKAAA